MFSISMKGVPCSTVQYSALQCSVQCPAAQCRSGGKPINSRAWNEPHEVVACDCTNSNSRRFVPSSIKQMCHRLSKLLDAVWLNFVHEPAKDCSVLQDKFKVISREIFLQHLSYPLATGERIVIMQFSSSYFDT